MLVKKKNLFILALGAAAICFNPLQILFSSSPLPYTPGEYQPSIAIPNSPWAIYPEGEGQILAQTFTPSFNQWLGFLQIPVGCSDEVLLNVKIREGLAGTLLYEVNVAGLPSVVDGTYQLIQVFNPAVSPNGIRLRAGREYSFELAAFPGENAQETSCGIARGPARNTYPRGRGYYQDPSVGVNDFVPLPDGSPVSDEDLPFILLVR